MVLHTVSRRFLSVAITIVAIGSLFVSAPAAARPGSSDSGSQSGHNARVRVENPRAWGVDIQILLRFDIVDGKELAREAVVSLRRVDDRDLSSTIGILEVRDSFGDPKGATILYLDQLEETTRINVEDLGIRRHDGVVLRIENTPRFEPVEPVDAEAEGPGCGCICTMERACEICSGIANAFCADRGIKSMSCGTNPQCAGCSVVCNPRST